MVANRLRLVSPYFEALAREAASYRTAFGRRYTINRIDAMHCRTHQVLDRSGSTSRLGLPDSRRSRLHSPRPGRSCAHSSFHPTCSRVMGLSPG